MDKDVEAVFKIPQDIVCTPPYNDAGACRRRLFNDIRLDDEQLIVDKLMAVNCTGEHGDGRIFTVDLQSSYSVREGKVMTI